MDSNDTSYGFVVKLGIPKDFESTKNGTKLGRGNFRCIFSNVPISYEYINDEYNAGRKGSRLMAVVAEGDRGRIYLSPTKEIEATAENIAQPRWKPDLASRGTWASNAQGRVYGFKNFSDYFTPRQLLALSTFSDMIQETREKVLQDAISSGMDVNNTVSLDDGGVGPTAYADAVAVYLGFALSKTTDYSCNLCDWHTSGEKIGHLFSRQAIQMKWDFCETNILSNSSGNILNMVEWVSQAIESFPATKVGYSNQADARNISNINKKLISTDPPYYDNIGYADLSDFFYVWLRESLHNIYPSLFTTVAVPKVEELVADHYRHGTRLKAEEFFLDGMTMAMRCLSKQTHPAIPVTIYYAFKQTESKSDGGIVSTGWQTFLEAVIKSGLSISGTWPVRTEYIGTLKKNVNALASSIVLVCRPQQDGAQTITRRDFLTILKKELFSALAEMQRGSIAPVDLQQTVIGPGMAVYTRYKKVIDNEGNNLSVGGVLGIINQMLDEVLAEQESDFDADTRWALTWFEQYGFSWAEYGAAEQLSKSKNTSVNGMVEAGILMAEHGRVRLLKPMEMTVDWDPATARRVTAWETVHQLIRIMDVSEVAAADLMAKLRNRAEPARELAYRLFVISEKKKRATDAMAYNSLVQSWPGIAVMAIEKAKTTPTQSTYL